jgi:hypothetical protein
MGERQSSDQPIIAEHGFRDQPLGSEMSQDPEKFEQLLRLLKLKRYERPRPCH